MTLTEELLKEIKIVPLMDTLRLEKIDDEEYFSERYSGYVSNSRLGLINPSQDNDPQAFFEGLGKHNKFGAALSLGSAVHEMTLQPELFKLCTEVDKPTAKMGAMADELFKVFSVREVTEEDVIAASDKVDYYKGKMNSDRVQAVFEACRPYWEARKKYEEDDLLDDRTPIYLDQRMRIQAQECVTALSNNKRIQGLLHPKGIIEKPISENEKAILLDVQVTVPEHEPFTIRLKAKLDNYTIDKETNTIVVNDVKTIGKILSYFDENFEKFHYYRELAIYTWLLSLCAKKYYDMDNCTIKSNCLVVSTIPNYYTKVYEVSKKDLGKGWNEFTYLIKLVAFYMCNGYTFE